ncbi:MBL fold metallo-hydrolase [Sphingomonas sp. MMS24-J45]|uniref:MBL fold metallo-hydrolase n=1 Tax=Sphingomonas sp. MMS24-J45 TaxID=3238806 RepID=UPI003850BC5F
MTPLIHVFAVPPDKFFVNSFIVESEAALVLVDTQFLVSTAEALADKAASLCKPLAGIVITHPHPDHFNGPPILLDRLGPVPVYATRTTIAGIAETQPSKLATWTPVHGDDYPLLDALPDQVTGSDETWTIGGIVLRVVDLGPGESSDITVLHVPDADALNVSDLVYHGCHPWLAEHRSDAWLDQLDRVESRFPNTLHIFRGHGIAGGRALFDLQRHYIRKRQALVAQRARGGVLDTAGLAPVHAATRAGRQDWPLAALVDMNEAALAAELAEQQT